MLLIPLLLSAAVSRALPDGGTISVVENKIERRNTAGDLLWRIQARPTTPVSLSVTDGAIALESQDFSLRDFAGKHDPNDLLPPEPLRIFWKHPPIDTNPTAPGYEQVGRNGQFTVWKKGDWFYIGGPEFFLRFQIRDLVPTVQSKTPLVMRNGDATKIVAGAAQFVDDGRFTVADLTPDWVVERLENARRTAAETESGHAAPEISIGRWLQTDRPLSLQRLRGHVVLIDFWGNWCTPCVREIPEVIRLRDAFRTAGFSVLSIHSQAGADQLPEFLRKRPYPVPIGIDANGETQKRYAVFAWPTHIVVDKNGIIRYRSTDLPRQTFIRRLLEGN